MYVRKTSRVKAPKRYSHTFYKNTWPGRSGDIYNAMPGSRDTSGCGLICFCGKAYPFWVLGDVNGIKHYFYLLENLYTFAICESNKPCASVTHSYKNIINELKSGKKMHWWSRNDTYAFSIEGHKSFMDNVDLTIPVEEFIEVDAPVFLLTDKEKIINPQLRLYNFVTQVDPFTAYQEIEMFVGNQLAKQMDPDLKRTDEEVAESKGFDKKWSFRKKGKKKK